MTPDGGKPNFLDRNTILAFVLILVFWIGWSQYMGSKQPPAPAPPQDQQAQQTTSSAAAPQAQQPASAAPAGAQPPANVSAEEKFVNFENPNVSFKISSKGMGLRDINIKQFKTRNGEPILLGAVAADYPFSTQLIDVAQPLDFKIEQTGESTFVGRAETNGLVVEKTLTVKSPGYALEIAIKVTGHLEAFKGVTTLLSDIIVPSEGGSFFNPSYDFQTWFVHHSGKEETRHVIHHKDAAQLAHQNVSIAAFSAHYFSMAVVDRSEIMPRFETTIPAGAKLAVGRLIYQPVSRNDSFSVKYIGFAGPKQFELLREIDPHLTQVIDFGFFGMLGKPILQLLKYLYTILGNWGWAIIVLTIIVRLLVMPFNIYSFKSMKAMQKIQPEMNRIRERYKDKPADQRLQMNQEIMQLMKTNKASPLGGCLPMLLQLPVFFALYQVLGQSIELYRAPFIFWIHDLSARDPFYVLPVLMGISMFVQQKIMPTTMDPQQAKILMWMPVIFSFFMIALPSGLTVYILVSTLFGITQQYIFMRDRSSVQSRVKEAKA